MRFLCSFLELLFVISVSVCSFSSTTSMVIDKLNTIVHNGKNPSAVVFFLHGFGDTAHGWASTFRRVAKDMPHVKFVLPTAALRPVTIMNGREVPAWFDVAAVGGSAGQAVGLDETRDALQAMIDQEVETGIPRSRIVVGGFSQGGAVSYFTGFQTKQPLGGVMILSSFIPREKDFRFTSETTGDPVLICHGDADSRISYELALKAKQRLADASVKYVTFHTYPNTDHSSSSHEIEDIREWLDRVLPATTPKQEL
ncbi:Acyl-protein thioesterase 1 [Phytophthora cinnamomi]|uniref:Acyl-protein thioesterase 1 n=1 Tax=Phytophthora cinnamomi TaxID=4785 RepID=UPI003559A3D3|nr:Acyl-protein thioesterase 1 [Phytophthora cinnamomi]